ncbi:polysaccharide deacetylase family protein [Castellaniella sp.]|uniref:polysaccharide deacetylase family protein n=1 Tax=Castellaniella sp. TaxID=1955812 RepID=UPI002AFEDA0C|nr:polysaccharide deacetylase family protein [Castellaniella sp.]
MSSRRTVPVLMYHHVTPAGGAINVTPAHFRDQLAWLKQHGYRSLTCAQFAAHLAGAPAPARSVLITFDDGYLDNYVHAWPLLREFGFHAVIFLVTSWVRDGPARHAATGQGDALPETPDHAICTRKVTEGQAGDIALRWSEIALMQADDVCEFHSHTHTHTRWDKQDPATKNIRMLEELSQSRACLQEHLGSVSDHLCWPQGYFDADYVRIARDVGFSHLYTTRAFGQNRPGADPASIFRFAVRNTSGASMGRRIQVAASPIIGPAFNAWKRWKRGQHYAG